MIRIRRVAVLAGPAIAWLACASLPAPDETLAAEVLGQPITLAEVDQQIAADLLEQRTQGDPERLLALRRQALDRMIDARLAEAEARRSGIPLEDAARIVEREKGEVEDEEIVAFFEENRAQMGDHGFEQMAPQIRRFLERQRRPGTPEALRARAGVSVYLALPRAEVEALGPVRGNPDAPVTIVEFADFQCPYCRRSQAVLDGLLERYPGDVRLVYRHLPIEPLHPRARAAAEAAACAQEQGRFWAYHDMLFQHSRALEQVDLLRYAEELGLDAAAFASCTAERRSRARVDADLAAARALGLRGTPAFFVNGILLDGAKPAEEFYRLIDAELEKATSRLGR